MIIDVGIRPVLAAAPVVAEDGPGQHQELLEAVAKLAEWWALQIKEGDLRESGCIGTRYALP